MNKRLEKLREQTRSGFYHQFRTQSADFPALEEKCREMSDYQAQAEAFKYFSSVEKPVIIPGEKLHFTRTLPGDLSQNGHLRLAGTAVGSPDIDDGQPGIREDCLVDRFSGDGFGREITEVVFVFFCFGSALRNGSTFC